MQTPSTSQLRTTIEILNLLAERINVHAAHFLTQMTDTRLGWDYATRLGASALEQNTRIQAIAVNWKSGEAS